MEFGSLIFLFLFLPVVIIVGNILKGRLKQVFLVVAGLFFYFFGMDGHIFVLIVSIFINWIFGVFISRNSDEKVSYRFALIGVTVNILILIFYKYSGFIISNIESLVGTPIKFLHSLPPETFPIGISFFTFVAISYLVDIYRKKDLVFRNPLDVAFTLSFFPKVFSGPITFHNKFFYEVKGESGRSLFEAGAKRFVYGLGKKVLIADTLAKCVNGIFEIPSGALTFELAWVGVLTFTLQIFMDFSGYTDMAVGLGKMLGYEIPENFNFPYIATSIKDFWKRWHITLSNWLQVYIFLPLAFRVMRNVKVNRKFGIKIENLAYYFASFITMFVCGLWHGAKWTFIIWGIFHGFFLILEHWKLGKFLKKKVRKPFRILYSLIIIVLGWVIFRSVDISYAVAMFKSMGGFGGGDGSGYFISFYFTKEILIASIVAITISFPVLKWIKMVLSDRISGGVRSVVNIFSEVISLIFFAMVFLASIMAVTGGTYSPFIYFKF